MTPDQVEKASQLVKQLKHLTDIQQDVASVRNAPSGQKSAGGYVSISGVGENGGSKTATVYYLQDNEFAIIHKALMTVADNRVDIIRSELRSLGVTV